MSHVFGNFTLGHLYSITFFLVPRFSQNLGFTAFVVFLLKEHFYSGKGFFLLSRLSPEWIFYC